MDMNFMKLLSPIDKEKYWKEDTKNLNYFFCVLLFFMEIMFYCLYRNWTFLWILSLIIGLIISSIVYIVLDMKLKNISQNKKSRFPCKRYKEKSRCLDSLLNGRGGRNRTRVHGFGDRCSTIEPHPYLVTCTGFEPVNACVKGM